MTTAVNPAARGLEGVVVADTRLSDVDGERGRLIIRGLNVEELAKEGTFESVAGLLWSLAAPDDADPARLRVAFAEARMEAFTQLPGLGDALTQSDAMDALRAGLSHLRDSGAGNNTAVAGAMAVYAAAWWRIRNGLPAIAPDSRLSHAADYLRMLRGVPASAHQVRALDTYLVTVADHGMNASTFTARVVASTAADTVSAVVAALCALKGPLHGGAPGPVLDMLDAIGAVGNARAWVEAELDAGRRVMGMGHRVYRVRDPRAAVFELR